MPYVYDRRTPTANFDPLVNKLNFDIGDWQNDITKAAAAALQAFITNVMQAIQTATGVDLTPWLADINAIVAALKEILGDLNPVSGTFDPVDALVALFNLAVTLATTSPTLLESLRQLVTTGIAHLLIGFATDVASIPLLDQIISAAGGFGTGLTGLIEILGLSPAQIGAALFGLTGLTLPDLSDAGANLMSLFNNVNLKPAGTFDPIAEAEGILSNVFRPAGAITWATQIPAHLFGNLTQGNASSNVLPDPGFNDSSSMLGSGLWDWDGTVDHTGTTGSGSVKTVTSGSLHELVGVPVATAPGQITKFGVFVKWSGVTASGGNAIVLAANAYKQDGSLISDPTNRVMQAIVTPATNTGSTATDQNGATLTADGAGWIYLTGQYEAPANTANVRIVLEVESVVSAGTVWFDDCLQQLLTGFVDAGLLSNIEQIPQLLSTSVKGFEGLQDLAAGFAHMFDGLASGFNLDTVTGATSADTFTGAQLVATIAAEGNALATLAKQILGIRTNKPTSAGANPTSEAMMSIGHFSSGGALTTSTLAAGNAISQTFRSSEDAVKGFFEFLASGTSVTNIFVNVYDVDPITFAKTKLWGSANIAASITSTMGYIQALIPSASQPAITASDNLLLEIVNNGTNALTLVTKSTGLPNHPSDFPPNKGATRVLASTGGAQPASLTDAQVTYSGVVPYINFGIADVPPGYMPPERVGFPSSGIYTIPVWARVAGNLIDLALLPGGAGGGSAINFTAGSGGAKGVWVNRTLVIGTDFPVTTTALTITRGTGGASGVAGLGGNDGGAGGSSTVAGTGLTTVTATGPAGGAKGGNVPPGLGPGTETYLSVPYFGGGDVAAGSDGAGPGGSGGGGNSYGNGGAGSPGIVWVTVRQP